MTEIVARRSLHHRSPSSLSLRRERSREDTPGDRSDDRELRVGTQIQAGCPDSRPVTLFLRLSTIGRGEPQICRSGHRHDGSVSAYPSLSRARGALSSAPSAFHPRRSPSSPPRTSHFPLSLPPSLSLPLASLNAPPLCAVHPFRLPTRVTVCGQHHRILGSGSMIVMSLSYIETPSHLLLQHSFRTFFGVSWSLAQGKDSTKITSRTSAESVVTRT